MEIASAICRCCLKAGSQMKNILMDHLEITSTSSIGPICLINECFKSVVPEISDLVGKTTLICSDCEGRLKIAFEFRQECLKSDTLLAVRATDVNEQEILVIPKVEIKQEVELEVQEEGAVFPEIFVDEIGPSVKKESRKRKHSSSKKLTSHFSLEKPRPKPSKEQQDSSNEGEPEAVFMCYYCDDELQTHKEFLEHREMHRTPGEWAIKRICNFCGMDVRDYVKHIQEIHGEYKPNVCRTCCKAFVIQNELKNHLLIHSDAKNVKCQSCPMAFKSIKNLQTHILTKPSHYYYCIFCGSSAPKIKDVVQHIQEKHIENRNKLFLPCYKCKKIFLSFATLDAHKCINDLKFESTDQSPHVCTDCNERFAQEEHISCHRMVCANRRNGDLHICHICQSEFGDKRKLTRHKSSAHRQKTYQCDLCGYQTKTRHSLENHASKHTEHRPFGCDHPGCQARFKSKPHLAIHKRSTHNDFLYECAICDKKFKSYQSIKSHMAQHCEKLKKYKCGMCPKVFNTKYLLSVHEAGHVGKRMFVCQLCPNVSYIHRSGLNLHNKSVHLKIGYECKFCDQWFAQDKSLVEHIFHHRGYKPYNCPMCRQGYVRRDKFRTHLRTHNIEYDENIHGFPESTRTILMSGLKVSSTVTDSKDWMSTMN